MTTKEEKEMTIKSLKVLSKLIPTLTADYSQKEQVVKKALELIKKL